MTIKKPATYAIRVKPEKPVNLDKIDTAFIAGLDKAGGAKQLDDFGRELNRLQTLLYAAGTHSLLVVLQGMDTAGKDGAIRGVMKSFNPQGMRVESFKVPTPQELAHDFLWRIHKATPTRGMIAIFNRSQYEDVLAVRVQQLVSEDVWAKRFDRINEFEKLLAQNDTIIVKCFLHISKEEQEERLLEREAEVEKAWKLSVGDWEQRKLWKDYQQAYEDALSKCSTPHAPWFVVPSDRKWFRNLAVAQVLAEALRPHEKEWTKVLAERSKESLEELKAYRAGGKTE